MTSLTTSSEAGATFVYHGQRVVLEWQSMHALAAMAVGGAGEVRLLRGRRRAVVVAVRHELEQDERAGQDGEGEEQGAAHRARTLGGRILTIA